MIVCTGCGYDNDEKENFCASCGGFLEWTGERIEAEPVVVPAAEPVLVGAAPAVTPAPAPAPNPEVRRERDSVSTAVTVTDAAEPDAANPDAADPDAAHRLHDLLNRLTHGEAHDEAAPAASGDASDDPQDQPEEAVAPEEAPEFVEAPPVVYVAQPADYDPLTAPLEVLLANAALPPDPAPSATATVSAPPEATTAAVDPVRQAALEHEAQERAAREHEQEQARQRAAALVSQPKPSLASRPPTANTPVVRRRPPAEPAVPEPRSVPESEEKPAAESKKEAAAQAQAPTEAQVPTDKRIRRRLAASTPDDAEIAPGDLICGQCGVGNVVGRNFCKRCGASLKDARPAAKPSWWRRAAHALKPHRRRRVVRAAGERKRESTPGKQGTAKSARGAKERLRGAKKLLVGVAGLALVAIVVGPFRPTVWGWYNSVRNKITHATHQSFTPVHPVSAVASSSVTGHAPRDAIDGISNSFWGVAARDGVGESLTLRLASPTGLTKIGFLSGAQDQPNDFLKQSRIKNVTVTLSNGQSHSFTLQDTANFQSFALSAKNVTMLRLTVNSVFPGSQIRHLALAEVELFKLA